jgi:ribosomal protein S18 acetylase RimI-like enzyme
MTQAEFDDYLEWAVPEYADELIRNTGIAREEAERHAQRAFGAALPYGLTTPDHRFLTAADADTGEHVGVLWTARQRRDGAELVWIFDIWVDEPMRGRGYGRCLMELAEEEARGMGVARIELNVYGDNARARNLYESLGYTEMSRQMYKVLDDV